MGSALSQYSLAIKAGLVIVLLAGIIWLNYHFVVDPAVAAVNKEWQEKWDARDLKDVAAQHRFTTQQRDIELARQADIDALQRKADEEKAKADLAIADAKRSADRMQQSIRSTITKLQQSSSIYPGTAISSASRAANGDLLSELYRSIDERTGELAEEADRRGRAGLMCETAYDAVRNEKAR